MPDTMTNPMTTPPSRRTPRLARGFHSGRALGIALLLGVTLVAGCRGDRSDKPPRQFFPDMDEQPRWNPQSKNEFYASDHRSMRQPVAGTVAFGRRPLLGNETGPAWQHTVAQERTDLLAADPRVYLGIMPGVEFATAWVGNEPDNFVDYIPVTVDRALLTRGRQRFDIYCSACHGYEGEGAAAGDDGGTGGMAGRRWSYPVPTFHDAKYKDPALKTGRDGYLFYTAMNGVSMGGLMPGYAHALDTHDAWAIVAYIRALQRSREATLDQVPQDQRRALQAQLQSQPQGQPQAPSDGGGTQ